MADDSTDVLVVGAGPTGLLLALLLAKLGVGVRVVDAEAEAGTTSRAVAVQARTLEFYRQIGLLNDVLARALVFGDVNLWRRGERVVHVDLSGIGRGVSPFPFGVIYPQDEHERMLIAHLEVAGVRVERRTTIRAIEVRDTCVARGTGPRGVQVEYRARFVAGCDGARSTVREAIGARFPGGTYDHVFYVADIEARGRPMNTQLHVFFDDAGFLALFPLVDKGHARLIGTIKSEAEGRENQLGWSDVDRRPVDAAGLEVERVNWFSTYRVHHRVADRFRAGNVFLRLQGGEQREQVCGTGAARTAPPPVADRGGNSPRAAAPLQSRFSDWHRLQGLGLESGARRRGSRRRSAPLGPARERGRSRQLHAPRFARLASARVRHAAPWRRRCLRRARHRAPPLCVRRGGRRGFARAGCGVPCAPRWLRRRRICGRVIRNGGGAVSRGA